MFWFILSLLFLPMTIFYPTKVIGKKNRIKEKCIIACNHQTLLDVPILAVKYNKRIYALSKKELFKNKFVSWFLRKIGAIPVDRNGADIDAIKSVLNVLNKKNKPILIFPSGTRKSSPEEVEGLKNSVAMFALKTDSPIVPVVFVKKPKMFRRNKLIIGEPLNIDEYKGKKGKEVYQEISEKLSLEMKRLIKENE